MSWVIIKKRLMENWQAVIIIILIAFMGYKYSKGDFEVIARPDLGVSFTYDEVYRENECFVMMTGHVVNYGGAYASGTRVVCRIDNSVETIKWWELDAGDIAPRSNEDFVKKKVDIPCSKVELVLCEADCVNCPK